MPIDPITGIITSGGTDREIIDVMRANDRIRDSQQAADAAFRGGPVGGGASPVAAAPGGLKILLNILVLGALVYIIPRAWPWAMSMLHQGRIVELGAGFVMVFMVCMMGIAVIVAAWQFIARANIIKLTLIAVCVYWAWRFIMPHAIPKPNIAPIVVAAPAAHPIRHQKR
jgi:hypothetical protein